MGRKSSGGFEYVIFFVFIIGAVGFFVDFVKDNIWDILYVIGFAFFVIMAITAIVLAVNSNNQKQKSNETHIVGKEIIKDSEPVVCTMTKIALKDYFTEHNLQITIINTIQTVEGIVFETNTNSLKEYEKDLIEMLGKSTTIKYHRIYVDEKDLLENILGFKQYEPPKDEMYLD